MDSCFIANQLVRAEFVETGAELRKFQTLQGMDVLWSGDADGWARVSPVLFPIVGELKGNSLRHEGRDYPLGRHGFARDKAFSLIRLSRESCTWMLRDDASTRAQYPFPFELWITYAVVETSLRVQLEVRNPGAQILPFNLGAHPAFRWPLPNGTRESHRLEFAKTESAPIRRLDGGLLDPHPFPNPVDGAVLRLRDDLFAQDALIFDHLESRSLRYLAPGAPGLEFKWEGFHQLGLWTRPGKEFICLEPWAGLPSPTDFGGEFTQKPGVLTLQPGARRVFQWSVRILPPS